MSTAESIVAVCFWCSAAGVIYAYLGYPALIFALSRLVGRRCEPDSADDNALPRVTLLVAAYNEAAVIRDRITNAITLSYPRDLLEIVIASDGSDDATTEIGASCAAENGARGGDRLRVLAFPQRRGKAATLNAAMEQIDSDIVVLSDANTMMEPDAVRRLVRWFADPRVGAVCGRLVLIEPRSGRNADGLYWQYETFLKTCEGRLSGPLGANGGIYAIRRSLFVPLPHGTVVDDFVLPLAAKLRSGCSIVYDPDAVAHEETAPDVRAEFRRRTRIGAGGFQALCMLWPLLSPRHGWTAFTFWSHKVLRWICPFFMIAALLGSLLLARHPLYLTAFIMQAAFYALSALGAVMPSRSRACRALRPLPMFVSMNLALLVGLLQYLRARPTGIWRRTTRSEGVEPPPASQSGTQEAVRHAA